MNADYRKSRFVQPRDTELKLVYNIQGQNTQPVIITVLTEVTKLL